MSLSLCLCRELVGYHLVSQHDGGSGSNGGHHDGGDGNGGGGGYHGGDGGGGKPVLPIRGIWLVAGVLGWAVLLGAGWLVWHVLIPAVTR